MELENVLKIFLNYPDVFETMGCEYDFLESFEDLKCKVLELDRDRLRLLNISYSDEIFVKKGKSCQTCFVNRSEELKKVEKDLVDLKIQVMKIQKNIDWLIE
jgi:hypothetical protein